MADAIEDAFGVTPLIRFEVAPCDALERPPVGKLQIVVPEGRVAAPA